MINMEKLVLLYLWIGVIFISSMYWDSLSTLLFPLLIFVVPFGWKALHRINSHVQHSLDLLRFVLRVKCVWNRSIHWKYTTPKYIKKGQSLNESLLEKHKHILGLNHPNVIYCIVIFFYFWFIIIPNRRPTIFSLPEHNQTGEANQEENPSNHSLPLWWSLIHLSKALFEADTVH